jgi:hypothetical protein
MKLPPALQKIAVFLIAISATLIVFYLVIKGMQWVFSYIGAFGLTQPASSLRIVGAVFVGAIVVLRFYLRRKAKQARQKKTQS